MYLTILRAFGVFLLMILAHEYGHWLIFKLKKVPYRFTFNKEHIGFDFENVDQATLFWIYTAAIGMGFLPLMLIGVSNIYLELLLIGGYLWGCVYDMKQIGEIIKNA